MKEFCAVIMAGGSGTRLWPLSRKAKPKQFYPFLSEKTLLQETYDRVASVVDPKRIFVSTGESYVDMVLSQVPALARDQLIVEPVSRNTGPAILLATSILEKRFPEAIVATIASDHAIGNPEEFTSLLKAAFEAAVEEKAVVTLGINPTRPDTGFGYIKMGEEQKKYQGKRCFLIESFREKPDLKTAEEYLRGFEYLWNAGYFIFQASTMLRAAQIHAPETLNKIQQMVRQGIETPPFHKAYAEIENIAIEPLIIEKLALTERLVIPAALDWSDVGNWATFSEYLENQTGNTLIKSGNIFDYGSKDLFVHGGKRLIATLNLENIVIVDTPDVLLVARKDSVGSNIKMLLDEIKKQKEDSELYL